MNNTIKNIQVLGTGCPTCKKLFELTKQATKDLGLSSEVEYINDVEKMLALGVMSSPVLVVDNKIVMAGQLPSLEKIKQLLSNEQAPAPKAEGGCCCGGC